MSKSDMSSLLKPQGPQTSMENRDILKVSFVSYLIETGQLTQEQALNLNKNQRCILISDQFSGWIKNKILTLEGALRLSEQECYFLEKNEVRQSIENRECAVADALISFSQFRQSIENRECAVADELISFSQFRQSIENRECAVADELISFSQFQLERALSLFKQEIESSLVAVSKLSTHFGAMELIRSIKKSMEQIEEVLFDRFGFVFDHDRESPIFKEFVDRVKAMEPELLARFTAQYSKSPAYQSYCSTLLQSSRFFSGAGLNNPHVHDSMAVQNKMSLMSRR